ncbi:helix-turn-helix domain-containing protein [Gemella sanguinis]
MKLAVTNHFQQFLKEIGIDIEEILKKAKVPNKLWNEEVTLNSIEYYNMLIELDKKVSESSIRTLSDIDNIHMFMPSFFAALSSPTGEEAIKRFSKYKKLVGPVELEYLITDKTIDISFSYVHKQQKLPKFAVLNEQLLVLSILRKGTGEDIVPLLVETPYEYDNESIKLFGIAPQKEEYNRIVFSIDDVRKSFLTNNNLMYSYIEPELNKQLTQVESEKSFSSFVQKELLSAIPSGFFKVEDLAETLGVSARTLQRNLSAENTTFKEQVQMIQKSMTFSYLKLGISTDEIAYLVGYTETNAFLRAFKKWTGMSLTQYKKINFENK